MKNKTNEKAIITRISKDLHDWLRKMAFIEDKSMQQITVEALEEFRAKKGEIRIDLQKEGSK